MKQVKLDNYQVYLTEVINHWKHNKTLNGFSKITKKHHVKGITKEQFFQYGLDKMDEVPRELSDNIRYDIQQIDHDRKYLVKEEDDVQHNGERIDFDAEKAPNERPTLDTLFGYLRGEIKYDSDEYKKEREVEDNIEKFLEISYEDYMGASQTNTLELKAAKKIFGSVSYFPEIWDKVTDNIKHAILTMFFADEYGIQRKLNYDAAGKECPQNEFFIKTLSDKGFLNDLVFAKIESREGGFYFCIVYKDAPDILVIFNGEGEIEYQTVDQFDLLDYSKNDYGGGIMIKNNISYGCDGGTRTKMMRFIDEIRMNKSSAVALQGNVATSKKGKLLYDLRNLNDLKQLYL